MVQKRGCKMLVLAVRVEPMLTYYSEISVRWAHKEGESLLAWAPSNGLDILQRPQLN